jgi:hypothetical protein
MMKRKVPEGRVMSHDRNNASDMLDIAEPKQEHCRCGWPDMPGQCPGWRNCPTCEEDENDPA